MAKEIERKFLVTDIGDALKGATSSRHIIQGYLSVNPDATVRIRLVDSSGRITVKSRNHGAERHEWEYAVPEHDAREMLALSQSRIIDKTRYLVPFAGRCWEVDVFHSHPELILAEVEIEAADAEVSLPPWVGAEVTTNPAYFNSTLSLQEPEL